MIALALCPTAAIETMEKIAPKLKKGAMIFDCCGVKRQIVAKMRELSKAYPDLGFLGVHPMAGREFSGISHSTPSLYERAYIIFTPVAAPIEKIAEVKKLFLDIGAEGVQIASADFHDRIIAYTSQLAHVVSSSYIRNPLSREHVGFSAGSFKDMTRVAKLNPDMWTELFLHNADYLTAAIEELQKSLSDLKSAISKKDADKLHKLLSEGAEMKEYAEKQRKNEEALKDLDKEPY
jgi:prephenate dehydrogenase